MNFIGFDNYRIFNKETFLRLKPITILTGPNSSGKSSVIKAAKLLKQNSELISGIPTDLNFLPDDFGHFLSEIDNIRSRMNKDSGNPFISFIFDIDIPYLPNSAFIRLTYGSHSKNKSKAAFYQLSFVVMIGAKFETVFTLSTDYPRQFFKDTYTRAFINFDLVIKLFNEKLLPYLARIEAIILRGEVSPKKMARIVKNLPHYKYKKTIRKDYIHPVKDYFFDIIKPQAWQQFDATKPVLPYFSLFTDPDIKTTISEEICKTLDVDYFETLNLFVETRQKELLRIIDSLGFNPETENDIYHRNLLFDHFIKYEKKLFNYIVKNEIWLPFIHSFSSRKASESFSLLQWAGISDKFSIIINKTLLDESFKKLNTFESFENFTQLDYIAEYFSDNESISNYRIILNFIEALILDTKWQLSQKIQEPFFYDSNRIEQLLFYHSSNSPLGYDLLNKFYEMDDTEDNERYSKNDIIINTQLNFLGIADEFEIRNNEFGAYSVKLIKNGVASALADHGYGITKLFFLLISIRLNDVLYIEEPETNLHPNFQSKLADLFASIVVKEEKQLIIETHSEYFIRKLQYLVASKQIASNKIIINYFNSPETREEEGIVKEINIRKDGSLSQDFGPGFFDEALNWKFELMKLKNMN